MTTKLNLYNRALGLLGLEILATDTESTERRYRLDEAYDFGAARLCLRLAQPTFARRTAALTSTTQVTTHGIEFEHDLPADYIALIDVFDDPNLDVPLRRRLQDDKIYAETGAIWLRYVSDRSTDLTSWSDDFSYLVAAYLAYQVAPRLAADRDAAKAMYDTALEQSLAVTAQEQAMAGAPRASRTLDASYLDVYNRALLTLGRRRLENLTQDSDDRAALDAVQPQIVDEATRTLRPVFARKTVTLTQAVAPAAGEFGYSHTLPADFQSLIGVYADADLSDPVLRYKIDGNVLMSERSTIFVRYAADVGIPSAWSPDFAAAVSLRLARAIVAVTDTALLEAVTVASSEADTIVTAANDRDEPTARPIKSRTDLTSDWLPIYNMALAQLGHRRLLSVEDEHPIRTMIDDARDAGVVTNLLADYPWDWVRRQVSLEQTTRAEVEFGPRNVFILPDDLLRIDGVFSDENLYSPLSDYQQEGGFLLTNSSVVFLSYIPSGVEERPSEWIEKFRHFVAAALAHYVAPQALALGLIDRNVELRVERKFGFEQHEARTFDRSQRRPQKIRMGDWTRARVAGNSYRRGHF